MATVRWKGGAQAVAQVTTVQVTAYDAATTYTLTVGSKSVSTIAAGSVNATASALATAWNTSTEPELAEVTASSSTDTVTLTADTAGVPFTASSSVSGGTGTIGAATTTTASAGPNDWSTANNWSGAAVPSTNDTVWVENSADQIKYGLSQSGVTLTALYLPASFTGDIGLPEVNQSGSTAYREYRTRYLTISATTLVIGEGEGQGSGRILINTGSNQTALSVHQSTPGLEADLEAIQWKGAHASNAVVVSRGSVGIAGYGGDAATVATLTVGYKDSPESDAKVRCGSGTSLTTLNQTGGQVLLGAGLTTVNKSGGTLEITAGNVTTLTDDGGLTVYRGAGTIATLSLSGAAIDFARGGTTRTVTNATLYRGSGVNDPLGSVTWTNPVRLGRCKVSDVSIDVGPHRTLAIAS